MSRLCPALLISFFLCASAVFAQPSATPVFVANVERVDFVDEVEALGTLQSNENVNLVSSVTERITAINFDDNQQVEQGQVLVEMDSAEEQALLIEEQSRRDEARRQVNRLRELVERGSASESALDEQELELSASIARINAIQSRINERRIIAPFDGVVGIRNISVGAMARPDTVITSIDDNRIMKLDFSIPEVFLPALEPGLEVEAIASAYPNRTFSGTVSSIDSRVDPVTRSVAARALLENEDGALKAGMLMRIQLSKNPRQTLAIPEEAIISAGQQNAVMVVEPGSPSTAQRQAVEIGARRQGEVEILAGLREGQQVVTHGALRLRPGAAVTVQAVERDNQTLTELLQQNNTGQN